MFMNINGLLWESDIKLCIRRAIQPMNQMHACPSKKLTMTSKSLKQHISQGSSLGLNWFCPAHWLRYQAPNFYRAFARSDSVTNDRNHLVYGKKSFSSFFLSVPNLSYSGCVRDVRLITSNKSWNFGDLWGELEIGMWLSSAGRTVSNNSTQERWETGSGEESDGEEGTASAHFDSKMALLSLFVS